MAFETLQVSSAWSLLKSACDNAPREDISVAFVSNLYFDESKLPSGYAGVNCIADHPYSTIHDGADASIPVGWYFGGIRPVADATHPFAGVAFGLC